MENLAERKGLSGSTLKIIAVLTMLIDHVAAVVLARMLWSAEPEMAVIYRYMRNIGRIAFPIYIFLLIEGVQKTRNIYKYALRLGAFALISEIPFDLAFKGRILESSYQNVFFTLFIGLLCIIVLREGENRGLPLMLQPVLGAVVICAGYAAAGFLHTDYGGSGVICILAMYLFRKKRYLQALMGFAAFALLFGAVEYPALPAFFLILFYSGRRGLKLKYLFYAFYPIHLLLLYGVCSYLSLV